ncbi:HD-GYP domain-containing protein [Paenibacillus solisilvae]|uniref:HD-GYP domain-containing protein n=1 Tax=Paenibacillus solisilvae TaxID=2486751 RepID=A0ABW0W0I4_9BACL
MRSEIHPYAKIMAIADVFDALTSNRAYRGAMLPHEAIEIFFTGSDSHFEPEIIKVFQKS